MTPDDPESFEAELAAWWASRPGAPKAPKDGPLQRLAEKTLLVLSCDYREPLERGERCACEGELARCWANRSLKSDRTVTRQECEACARERPRLHRAT